MIAEYLQIHHVLSGGGDIVLATIVDQKGSAPRTTGTPFLIHPDGTFSGTIGGGKLEADVLQAAPRVFAEEKNILLSFRLKGEEVARTEMICGGELDIYLQFYSGRNPFHQALLQAIFELTREGREGVLITRLPGGDQCLFSLSPAPSFFPAPPPDWVEPRGERLSAWIRENRPFPWLARRGDLEEKLFIVPLKPRDTVYLFGAGHISRPLCSILKLVDFRVVVVDDREEFANRIRFPEADEVLVRGFDLDPREFSFGSRDYVVIITRGHLHDHDLLKQILTRPVHYIGMIGSRHKREVIYKALRQEGFPQALLETIHAPIGIDIQAQTPAEIAVSIAAELIQVRGGEKPRA